MTRYHFANQEKKEKISRTRIGVTFFALVAVVVVAIFILAPVVRRLIRGPQWLATSIESQTKSTISILTPKKIVLAENSNQEQRIKELEAQNIELAKLKIENAELRKEVSYFPDTNQMITAQVIGKPNRSLFNSLIIDSGANQGIRVGQLVTTHDTLGIGTIATVTDTTAVVELFAGPYFSGDVILTQKNIIVPATGKGSGNFQINIPREVQVADGDLLAFPENPEIIVGVVKSIIFDPRDPFQTVLARAPVNVQELRFVQVVK